METQQIILVVLIFLSGFFSGSETALVSVTPSKVDQLVKEKRKNSKLLKKLKNDPNRLLITVLIANNLVNIFATALATVVFTKMFGSSGVGIATGVMTFFILVFGEITPKAFAHEHSAVISLWIAKPIYILQVILMPVIWFFERIVKWASRWVGASNTQTVTEGELVAMLSIGAKEGAIEKREKELIENVLEFNDIKVEEVMTPRVTIDALNIEMSLKEAVDFALSHSHSRLPVYEESIDNIVGVVSIKELLKFSKDYSSRKKLCNIEELSVPLEVPYSKPINTLFKEFQKKRQHLAIVIDEYGGTAGLVTLEDVLEEIVGEIEDEFDIGETPFEIVNKKTIVVAGDTEVEAVNDFFKMKFGPRDHDTVSSLVTEHLQRFPREGEVVKFAMGTVTILEMDDNVVAKAKIVKKVKRK